MATLTAIPPGCCSCQRPYLDLGQQEQAVAVRARAGQSAGQLAPRSPAHDGQPTSDLRAAGARRVCPRLAAVDRRGQRVRPSVRALDPERLPHSLLAAVAGSVTGQLGLLNRGTDGSGRRAGVGGQASWRGEPARRGRVGGRVRHEEAAAIRLRQGSFRPDNLDPGCCEGTALQSSDACGTFARRDLVKISLTAPPPNGRRYATSGMAGPAGGTMDTSRRPAGPIDSRPDQQLHPIQGRHIMMWRQTWRQMW